MKLSQNAFMADSGNMHEVKSEYFPAETCIKLSQNTLFRRRDIAALTFTDTEYIICMD